jgi:MYXO-CTERM domain-containing protein
MKQISADDFRRTACAPDVPTEAEVGAGCAACAVREPSPSIDGLVAIAALVAILVLRRIGRINP